MPQKVYSGTIGGSASPTNAVTVPVDGAGRVCVQIAGTYSGTISFLGNVDGTNNAALLMTPIGTTAAVTLITGGATGVWGGEAGGLANVVVQMSGAAWTSGTAGVIVGLRQ